MDRINWKIPKMYIFILGITLIYILRVIYFTSTVGGIEHDSGWYLGVARNLAERGIYASYTNTVVQEGKGVYPSIHGRFSVQDKEGFTYFPAGVSVGPGYLIPEALMLKIFGSGMFQYQIWPLLAFGLLLFTILAVAFRIGGLLSFILLATWLWAIPQFYTSFAYEAFSEPIATLFLILSFISYYKSDGKQGGYLYIFLSGLALSASVLTKVLFFITLASFIPVFVWEVYKYRKVLKTLLIRWLLFVAGFILLIGIFEAYKYFFLVSNFGLEAWNGVNEDFKLHFASAGGNNIYTLDFKNLDFSLISKKIKIWLDVGVAHSFIIWLILIVSPVIFIRAASKRYLSLIIIMYSICITTFAWFILYSPSGLARYAWHSLLIGMLIICISLGLITREVTKKYKNAPVFIFIFVILIFSLFRIQSIEIKPILTEQIVEKWQGLRHIRGGLQGFPSSPILSVSDQKDIVSFFNKNIFPNDRVYYVGWFLNAEISPLVDKVFYTLDRYLYLDRKNPDGGKSFAIFGPYQQGRWSFMPSEYVPIKTSQLCETIIYQNLSYLLCELKKDLAYKNDAYN